MKEITRDIYYIGFNNKNADLFESQFKLSHGMSYNSYLIKDEKIVIIDAVEIDGKDVWFKSIEEILGGKSPDYLIVEHMEPDHSGSILEFIKKYPEAKIVTNQKSLTLLDQFFDYCFDDKVIIVKEFEKLELGKHTLNFVFAPMVHWPEVMMVYEEHSKTLFSADAFGKFGTTDTKDNWIDEARRYYFGIISKYGFQVQSFLKKICNYQIERICSLHGPVLDDDICKYIEIYNRWSSYRSEDENGVFIAYTSIYGNTKSAVMLLKKELEHLGIKDIEIKDLARSDIYESLALAFKYKHIVLASTTYNNSIFPPMHDFLIRLVEHGLQDKTIGIIENGSWVPQVEKIIKTMLITCKNIKILEQCVHVKSGIKDINKDEIKALAEALRKE